MIGKTQTSQVKAPTLGHSGGFWRKMAPKTTIRKGVLLSTLITSGACSLPIQKQFPEETVRLLTEPEGAAPFHSDQTRKQLTDWLDHRGLFESPKTGDIIIGIQHSSFNLLTSLACQEFTLPAHVGIVSLHEGTPYVYESLGHLNVYGTKEPLLANIEGSITRRPLQTFTDSYLEVRFIRLQDENKNQKMADFARHYFHDPDATPYPFDPYFNPLSEPKCCTEFVRLCMEEAGYLAPLRLTPKTNNPDLSSFLSALYINTDSFLTTQSIMNYPNAKMTFRISRFKSEAERRGFFIAYEILHKSFQEGLVPFNQIFDSSTYSFIDLDQRINSYFDCATQLSAIADNPLHQPLQIEMTEMMRKNLSLHFPDSLNIDLKGDKK